MARSTHRLLWVITLAIAGALLFLEVDRQHRRDDEITGWETRHERDASYRVAHEPFPDAPPATQPTTQP